MTITLYDLSGADKNRRFSPYCWRTKLALAHKGLDYDTEVIQFTKKEAIAHSNSATVPVLDDGENTISDSFNIAVYLDKAYPEAPALMGNDIAIGQAKFIETWANTQVMSAVFRYIILDVFSSLSEEDQVYFRESREKRFGMTLEEFSNTSDDQLKAIAQSLAPLRAMLSSQPFLSGDQPAYADYILMGVFLFATAGAKKKVISEDDKVHEWFDRMLDLFDGLGRKA